MSSTQSSRIVDIVITDKRIKHSVLPIALLPPTQVDWNALTDKMNPTVMGALPELAKNSCWLDVVVALALAFNVGRVKGDELHTDDIYTWLEPPAHELYSFIRTGYCIGNTGAVDQMRSAMQMLTLLDARVQGGEHLVIGQIPKCIFALERLFKGIPQFSSTVVQLDSCSLKHTEYVTHVRQCSALSPDLFSYDTDTILNLNDYLQNLGIGFTPKGKNSCPSNHTECKVNRRLCALGRWSPRLIVDAVALTPKTTTTLPLKLELQLPVAPVYDEVEPSEENVLRLGRNRQVFHLTRTLDPEIVISTYLLSATVYCLDDTHFVLRIAEGDGIKHYNPLGRQFLSRHSLLIKDESARLVFAVYSLSEPSDA